MLKPSDMIIENKSIGSKYLLVEVRPKYEYVDNRRTDKVAGYGYTIVLPEKHFEKLIVRIDGPKLMDTPDGYVDVGFDKLELYIYWYQGQYAVGARAAGIYPLVDRKT